MWVEVPFITLNDEVVGYLGYSLRKCIGQTYLRKTLGIDQQQFLSLIVCLKYRLDVLLRKNESSSDRSHMVLCWRNMHCLIQPVGERDEM